MVLVFPYSLSIGRSDAINSSIYYRLKDDEYKKLLKAYKHNNYPLFLNECDELAKLERDIRNSIYSENAAIYLANRNLIKKIIDDDKLGLNGIDIEEIISSYLKICNCDILFPKEVAKVYQVL